MISRRSRILWSSASASLTSTTSGSNRSWRTNALDQRNQAGARAWQSCTLATEGLRPLLPSARRTSGREMIQAMARRADYRRRCPHTRSR